jgi:hypothetical protein
VGDEEACQGIVVGGGWLEIFLTVTHGDDSRLCHGDDVSVKGSEEAR